MTDDRPPYDRIGPGFPPVTEAELEAAVAAWDADNPGQHPGGLRTRLQRLNAEAREWQEAERLGVSTWAIRQAEADAKQRRRQEREARELAIATRAVQARDPAVGDSEPDGRASLSEADVLLARRRWQRGEGHPWKNAGVSEATYTRLRHRYGLVPWPEEYRDKMRP